MDIAAFISELLEHENDLIVPGLGSFYRSRVEGYYSKELQQFYPPTLQLQFDSENKTDDGKLVKLLMADQHISEDAAKDYIAHFVAQLLSLVISENVTLGNLGTFSFRRNTLVFAARKLSNNNEVFYGLVPAKLKRSGLPVAETVNEKPVLNMPVTETSAFTAALLRGEPMPVAPLEEETAAYTEAEENDPGKTTNWILIAALLLLITGLGLVAAYKYKPELFNKVRGINEPPPVSDLANRRRVSDSIKAIIQAQKDIGIKPKVDSAMASKIEAPIDTFAIVIATFDTYSGASKEYDRYTYKGLNVEIRKKPRTNRYQIDIAAYFNPDSAKAHLQGFKEKLKSNDLYIQSYPYQKK